jgi:hypothetical protein
MMIRVIEMKTESDDVSIEEIRQLSDETSLRDIYDSVKDLAMTEAKNAMLYTEGRTKYLLEMGENEEGLPHASIYIDKIIERQIFATRN